MDQIRIGQFIAGKRKELKMTQAQLGEKLGVTDKSVSKWERGVCLPDVSLYQDLCRILGISLNEFFAGEHIDKEKVEAKSEENIISIVHTEGKKRRNLKRVNLALVLVLVLAVGCLGYGIRALNQAGYFNHNYVSTYDLTDEEREISTLLAGLDGDLFKFKVDEDYTKVTYYATYFEGDKLICKDEILTVDLEGSGEKEGAFSIVHHGSENYTVSMVCEDNYYAIETAYDFGVDLSEYGFGWAHSTMTSKVEPGKEIGLFSAAADKDEMSMLCAQEVLDGSESLANNDYTMAISCVFE